MNPLLALARPEIVSLTPYSHAVWRPSLTRLHANEAPWRPDGDDSIAGLNRYPEPQPAALISALASLYEVPQNCLLACRGADDAIDLLSRVYLRAGQDAILQMMPTFGMYAVCARIQGAGVTDVPLRAEQGWALDPEQLLAQWSPAIKLVYLCSPNNPTGNDFDPEALRRVCSALDGKAVVVIDEAYIEWSERPSSTRWLNQFQNLAILRTLSKAHALAGARLGALIAAPELIELARRVLPPYALAQPTVEAALRALAPQALLATNARRRKLLEERNRLSEGLARSPLVAKVWPSNANFLLIDCHDAERFMSNSIAAGLIVRDLRTSPALPRSLRVSVGATDDNDALLRAVGVA